MPRSDDGRWTRECKLCGTPYFQRRPAQEYCSRACSNKASPGVGGRKPDRSLSPRNCAVCGKEFQPYRDYSTCCSTECYRTTEAYAEAQRRSDKRPERRARQNQVRRTNPVRVAKARKDRHRARLARYGVTAADYERMLTAQGGVCMICGQPPKPDGIRAASRLHADHDHETKRPRDLLCLRCNVGLGYFGDDPVLLRAAAEYVERHRAAGVPS